MILFDTETTGLIGASAIPLAKQPFIIEICVLVLDDKTLKEVAVFDEMINTPGRPPLEPLITKITGIQEPDLVGKRPFSAFFDDLVKLWRQQDVTVAHNCSFDCGMLCLELRRLGMEYHFPWTPRRVCTVEASYHIHNRRMKLEELCEHATGSRHEGAHRAINDVRALADVVRWAKKKGMIKL